VQGEVRAGLFRLIGLRSSRFLSSLRHKLIAIALDFGD
jgi:hypothetical protein